MKNFCRRVATPTVVAFSGITTMFLTIIPLPWLLSAGFVSLLITCVLVMMSEYADS